MSRKRQQSYRTWFTSLSYEQFVEHMYKRISRGTSAKVRRNKKYVGKSSGHRHQIDVSVETSVLGGLSLLILVECKHYRDKVKVRDLLAFAERIHDIGAHKGVVVTTIGFQRGAIKIANAHGIALVKTQPQWQHIKYCRRGNRIDGMVRGTTYTGSRRSKDDAFVGLVPKLRGKYRRYYGGDQPTWKGVLNALIYD